MLTQRNLELQIVVSKLATEDKNAAYDDKRCNFPFDAL